MSKGLKTLKEIFETIEAVDENANCHFDMEELADMFVDVEKELKALEIIKEKNVFVWGFIHRKEETKDFEPTYDYYKTHYGYFHSGYEFELLTKKEYDLLKEVLL